MRLRGRNHVVDACRTGSVDADPASQWLRGLLDRVAREQPPNAPESALAISVRR